MESRNQWFYHKKKRGETGLTIPSLPILPHNRLPRRPRRPRLNIKMNPTITTILITIARAPAPMVSIRETRINNMQDNATPTGHAIAVSIEAAGAELVALPASGAAVWLAAAVEGAGEKFLVDGAGVDAWGGGPLPGLLAAVAGGAHPAVVLWGEG